MEILDGTVGDLDLQRSSDVPVLVDGWAEAVVELARWQSRRRHPSNHEPSWEKDGGYPAMEWVI